MTVRRSYPDAAVQVLREAGGPLHYREIVARALKAGILTTDGKTPERTMNAALSVELHGQGSRFRRVGRGEFDLAERGVASSGQAAQDSGGGVEATRVRVPLYPLHDELRRVLPVWDGVERTAITRLRGRIMDATGTPQDPVDWRDPDGWIQERLEGADQELARGIWEGTGKTVNPRHVFGHWRVAELYGLLEDSGGTMGLTERGRSFLAEPLGEIEREIDEGEGLLRLLTIVSERAPAARKDILGPWREYCRRYSNFQADASTSSELSYRLRNLFERALVRKAGGGYELTPAGAAYLEQTGGEAGDASSSEAPELGRLIQEQRDVVKESLQEALESLDPIDFEHLIGRLLEELGYDNIEVTAPSNDKGIDVLGDIQVGITSVREVVQVKRHKAKIQRKDLDALRGCLHRFDAVRATIITSGEFARGTLEAAFEKGAAPITLINGGRLVELLIEHGIGVRKRTVELWEFDATDLAGGREPVLEAEGEAGGD